MRKILIPFLLFVFSLPSASQNGTEPVKVSDMLKIRSLGGVSLNKQGTQAVFTVTSIEPDGDSKWEHKYVNQLWLVPTDGSSSPRQLTNKENASQGAFSPDGKQLAFARTVDGKSQIFLIAIDGGEAKQLTKFKYGAGNPKWSPDGKQLLFSANIPLHDLLRDSLINPSKEIPVWSYEKPGFEKNEQFRYQNTQGDPDGNMNQVRAYLENNVTDKKARVVNKLNFQDESDVNPDLGFNNFFITEVVEGSKPKRITKGFFRYNFAEFSPDGNEIVIVGDMDSLHHPDRSLESSIYLVKRNGDNWRKIFGEEGTSFVTPVISPSGKWLAFQYGKVMTLNYPTLAFISLKDGNAKIVDIPYDRNKTSLTWSPDEKYIYFTTTSNGGFPLCRADIKSKKVEQLTSFDQGVGSFAIGNNKIVYVKTEVANPFELYTSDAAGKNEKRLSSFNTGWLATKRLSFPEKKTFVNDKGQAVEYWVMKPTNYTAGNKYPLLLEIHGGPSSMWGPGESSMWHEYQYFCSKGYGVVYSNPRGSGGYGEAFLQANKNDWGKGPASDVLTALDKTVAEGWADTSKLALTGGSYAGYLVAWIIAHDQRFKAACAQRGVYDLATFFGEGNAWRLVPVYFGGYPWDPATKVIIERESPINYVQHIKTPFIIFHGENDRRTGVIQSEMMYRSLKALGRPVEYVRHPNATHEITRSGNNRQRIDQLLRTWEFFERYLRSEM